MTKIITLLDNAEIIDWDVDTSVLDTSKFWAPFNSGLFPEFVSITNDYVKQQDIEYKISKFKDINKSKPWLIFLAINFPISVNFNDKPLLASKQLFRGIPDNIINELVNGNAYLIISFEQESHTNQFLDLFYALYRNNPVVPANKLIHITAAQNIHGIYDEYCLKNNISNSQRIQIWFSPYSLLGPIQYHSRFYTPTPTNKEKKFLNFNRAPRSHRILATSLLAEYGLLEHGYISLGISEYRRFQDRNNILEYMQDDFPRMYNLNDELQTLSLSGINKLLDALPLTIDTDEFAYGPTFGYSGDLMRFYDKSYFSVVSNTHFFAVDESAITLNEKEYKPILARHPFILIASPGTLTLLKTLGFKTFDQWFDESYDAEINESIRMLKIINEIDRLCKIDNATWDIMIAEMAPVLEHNYNWIVNHTNDIIFSTDFKHILEYAV
jgi:hypothetical protein